MSNLMPIEILAGVEPSTDNTPTTTQHYTFSKGIRFVGSLPEKVGGWASIEFNNLNTILGKARSIFSYKLNGYTRYLIGTNTNLYDVFGTALTNITPLDTTPIAIADSLDTFHGTLTSNPITTVSGSATLTITDAGHKFQAGDTVTLSGASTTNGVPDSEINAAHFIRSVSTNSYTIIVSTSASSSGTGGGASVVRASGYITVNSASHGLSNGDRVKIQDAATTGGITDVQINLEFIIRNSTENTFDVYTAGTSTSAVTGGGGVNTEYLEPIASGSADTLQGTGYGVGLYGVGLYGVSKTSTSTFSARLWSHDRFGNLTVSCFNNQSDIYSWDGSILSAPVKVANSPPANYVFVSNEILVALGYDSGLATVKENGISWSDQGGITNWTTGQSGSDSIEGAGKFISHAKGRGENLLFTESQTYTFRYIGGQFIWQTSLLDGNIGIISQNARASASGVVFWMNNNNFYMWRGGNVEVIPSNSGTESTILRYVFDDINFSQKEKIFCWYNEEYREVSWHYPSSNSNEPDRVAKVNIDTFVWVIDEIDRTSAEYPSVLTQNPLLISSDSIAYYHETGMNNDNNGLDWRLTTPFIYGGDDTVQLEAIIPDCTLTGNISVNVKTKNYPFSISRYDKDYTITNSTERLPIELNGRYWQFDLSGNDLNQSLMFGQWFAEIKKGSPR